MYRIGIDVGGTFTDFVLIGGPDGATRYHKVLSTPQDPSLAIVDGLVELIEQNQVSPDAVSFVGHGTTVATNMILERKGVKTALLTTSGFRDVLDIGRQARPHLYNYAITKPEPVVRRALRLEVEERLDANGIEIRPLDEAAVRETALQLAAQNVAAVAVSFLHAYRNPEHEARCKAILQGVLPDAFVSISSEVLPEFREYERTSTTVLNAYIGPRMRGYMRKLEARLEETSIAVKPLTFHSNGGLLSSASVEQLPVLTCLSGPAAGVVGAVRLGASIGDTDIVTFDVGGTSTDVSLIAEGKPRFTSNRLIDGHPIKLPMIDIHVVGAGGGSIARIDDGGALKVGPQSAGALPGPIAYGKGGELPTITDANISLGRLNPVALLDGRVAVDRASAWEQIERQIAKPLGLSVEDASLGMVRIANANMSRAIRSVSSEHGFDLSRFTLYAFGGAGPLHAVEVAIECGISRVLIPWEPGTMCARGILLSDISRDFVQTRLLRLDAASWSEILAEIATMRARGDEWLGDEGVAPTQRDYEVVLDARYFGQTHEVHVTLPAYNEGLNLEAFAGLFSEQHRKTFGYVIAGKVLEVVNVRLKAIGRVRRSDVNSSTGLHYSNAPVDTREAYFSSTGWLDTAVYRRADIAPGSMLKGPVIIEEMSSTTVVPDTCTVTVDDLGNLIIEVSP